MSDINASHTTQSVNTSIQKDAKNTLNNATGVVADKCAAAYNAVANHPITQNITNGPVAENVKDQAAKTSNEFSNLSASRTTPPTSAATGQPLTHYHSFFTTLLSWNNPRASGIAYAAIVVFIFGARYLDLLRYAFKITWMTLGVTVAAEIAGKTLMSRGLVSNLRPSKYYVLPKDILDVAIGDVHELVNFFLIEVQRIVFADNILVSAAAFIGTFISYFLIKLVPFWGFSLIAVSTLFLAPLIYKANKELIDTNLRNISEVVNQQTEQVKNLAVHHASAAANTTKQYVSEYSAKAQEMIHLHATSPVTNKSATLSDTKEKAATIASKTEQKTETWTTSKTLPDLVSAPVTSEYKATDFPAAPKEPFVGAPSAKGNIPSVGETANALKLDDEPLLEL